MPKNKTNQVVESVYKKMLREKGLKKQKDVAMSYSSTCDICGDTQNHLVKRVKYCTRCLKQKESA